MMGVYVSKAEARRAASPCTSTTFPYFVHAKAIIAVDEHPIGTQASSFTTYRYSILRQSNDVVVLPKGIRPIVMDLFGFCNATAGSDVSL